MVTKTKQSDVLHLKNIGADERPGGGRDGREQTESIAELHTFGVCIANWEDQTLQTWAGFCAREGIKSAEGMRTGRRDREYQAERW